MHKKFKISICMMVKNEEKYLEESLRSLNLFFDSFPTELIIVDTGSEDRTVEIAKKYTNNVFFHKWNDDFGSMRNTTINYASGEWILVLDGDEIFEDAEPIINFLKSSKSNNYNAISIAIKNISSVENQEKSQPVGNLLRLFRNTEDFRYEGVIHEQPRFKKPIYLSNATILHYGYDYIDNDLMEYKFERNANLLHKELKKNPHDIYMLFQLSQTYSMYKKEDKALEIIKKAYDLIKNNTEKIPNHLYIYNQLFRLYSKTDKYLELESICEEAIEVAGDFLDFYYYLAIAQMGLNKNEKSLSSFKKYLSLLEEDDKNIINLFLVKDTLDFYENAYFNMAVIYEEMKKYNKAIKYLRKITKKDLLEDKINLLVKINLELKQYKQLQSEYNIITSELTNHDIKKIFWKSIENKKTQEKLQRNKELIKLFTKGNDEYALLNKLRIQIIDGKFINSNQLINEVKKIEFNNLGIYFADAIYYLMINNVLEIGSLLSRVNINNIELYIVYLIDTYDDEFKHISLDYMKGIEETESFSEIRFNKSLKKVLLTKDFIGYNEYKEIFNSYLKDGIKYIQEIYNKRIIEDEIVYDVKNYEEAFLIYMYKAKKYKYEDQRLYVHYLREGLEIYPEMKKGIQLFIEELNNNADEEANKEEFHNLQVQIKESIKDLVNKNKLVEAKELISQYNKLVKNDIDIYAIKSVIAIMEGDMYFARKIIKDGLKIDRSNINLNYNLAYIMEQQGKYKESYSIYKRIYENTNDTSLKEEVYDKLLEIKKR